MRLTLIALLAVPLALPPAGAADAAVLAAGLGEFHGAASCSNALPEPFALAIVGNEDGSWSAVVHAPGTPVTSCLSDRCVLDGDYEAGWTSRICDADGLLDVRPVGGDAFKVAYASAGNAGRFLGTANALRATI